VIWDKVAANLQLQHSLISRNSAGVLSCLLQLTSIGTKDERRVKVSLLYFSSRRFGKRGMKGSLKAKKSSFSQVAQLILDSVHRFEKKMVSC
jgi:hypothetical protein